MGDETVENPSAPASPEPAPIEPAGIEPTSPDSITYEQAQQILDILQQMQTGQYYLLAFLGCIVALLLLILFFVGNGND